MLDDRFSNTLLLFDQGDARLVIDLRRVIDAEHQRVLSQLGPGDSFGVVTAANAMGRLQSAEENSKAYRELETTLERLGAVRLRVDGASPDLAHREAGFAIWSTESIVRALADEFNQLAYFWYDGERFWLVDVSDGTRLPLPIH